MRTNGYGHNFKIGGIFKPINQVRLGISVHTPTYYRLHDYFNTSMHSSITYDDGTEKYDEYSPENYYDYRLKTPMRSTFSGAFIIAKRAILSVDYELVHYGKAQLRNGGDGYNFDIENQDISEAFRTSGNLRIGGEFKATKNLSLRTGYELQQSAYKANSFGVSQPNSNANLNVFSGGLGYRLGDFFADVAYRYSVINDQHLPYPTPESENFPEPQFIDFKTAKNDVLFTFGFKF